MATTKRKAPTSATATPAVVTSLAPTTWLDWTVNGVRAALRAHEEGDFSLSAVLAEHVRQDDRVFAALDSLVLGTLGLPFSVLPSEDGDPARCQQYASDASRWWWNAFPEALAAQIERSIRMMGIAVTETVYQPHEQTGELRPHVHVHYTEHVRWNQRIRRYQLRSVTGPVDITPGDGRWMLFAPSGVERPWLNGAIRALAIPFLIRSFARRDWARRSEIEGVGVRKARVPKQADPAILKAFLNDIRQLGAETTIRLPEGFDFDIAVAEASAADGFQKLINHCDSSITLALLGQNLTTQIEGGSYAAAAQHARVLLTRLKAAVAVLGTTLRTQLVQPWGRLNYEGWSDDDAPWPTWDARPAEDVQSEATALQSAAQAITSLKQLGIDVAPIAERFGLKFAEAASAKLPEIYGYELDKGIFTINEVRKRKGEAPQPWGDVRTNAEPAPAEPGRLGPETPP